MTRQTLSARPFSRQRPALAGTGAKKKILLIAVFIALFRLAAAGGWETSAVQEPSPPVFSKVSQIRSLSREEAARKHPVSLLAQVTYVEAESALLFVRDQTGGIFVVADPIPDVREGDQLEIHGFSSPGDVSPVVRATGFRKGGAAALPDPSQASAGAIQDGSCDCDFVRVKGVVRRAGWTGSKLRLLLATADGKVEAQVREALDPDLGIQELVGAEVDLTGVCGLLGAYRGDLHATLLAGDSHQLRVSKPAGLGRGPVPIRALLDLAEISGSELPQDLFVIRGEVIGVEERGILIVRDTSGKLEIRSGSLPLLHPGAQVEVRGFLGSEGERSSLERHHFLEDSSVSMAGGRPATGGSALPQKSHGILTDVAAIRRLSRAEAARKLPVSVQGIVTYTDPGWNLLFIQDKSAGIFISGARPLPVLRSGQRVRVQGNTGPGDFAPVIEDAEVIPLATGELPKPIVSAIEELLTGRQDCQYVSIQGLVRSTRLGGDGRTLFRLSQGRVRFEAVLLVKPSFFSPETLVDSIIRLDGVCAALLDQHGRLTGLRIYSQSFEQLASLVPGTSDPFSLPPTRISEIFRFTLGGGSLHRLRARAQVTMYEPGAALFIFDGEKPARVEAPVSGSVKAGDWIDVVGFPVMGPLSPVLEDAVFRVVAPGSDPVPLKAPVEEIQEGVLDSRLVLTEARLIGSSIHDSEEILTCQAGALIFDARLAVKESAQFADLRPNSVLALTGVVNSLVDETNQARGFRILLRQKEDVRILSTPPLFTAAELLYSVAGLAGLAVMVFGWAWMLRRRVQDQTQQIRQRLEREAALEQRYMKLFSGANDLIQCVGDDGRIRYANPAWLSALGYDESEVSRMHQLEVVHPSHHQECLQVFEEVLAGRPVGQFETVFVAKDGHEILVEGNCTPETSDSGSTAVQAIFRDITARKRAEKMLQLSEERFSKAFASNPVATCITSCSDGSVLDLNSGFVKLTGYCRKEALGLTDIELGIWKDRADRDEVLRRLEAGDILRDADSSIKSKSGGVRSVLLSAEIIEVGGRRCFLITVHDVTERLSLEAQLRQAQKMESIGRLAAGVAHDFNNLLTIIQGHSQLLLAQKNLKPASAEALSEVADAADRAADLTRQLLTFSRKTAPDKKPADLNEIIQSMAVLIRRITGEAIELKLDLLDDLPRMEVDRAMIEQLLMNLAVNARDAMPNGGKLAISTKVFELASDRLLPDQEVRAGTFVGLKLADTGTGMSKEVLERIFDPFFTTKDAGKGTGLGLAIVYAIVKQHSGWIEVTSSPGKGTEFQVYLPASRDTSELSGSSRRRLKLAGGTETVLLVEDEAPVRKLLAGLLTSSGYRVIEAEDGRRAQEIWRTSAGEIDLLLSDLVMPGGISGFDLVRQFRESRPTLKAILTSGYSGDSLGTNLDQLRDVLFIPKPYRPDEFMRKLRGHLNGKANQRT